MVLFVPTFNIMFVDERLKYVLMKSFIYSGSSEKILTVTDLGFVPEILVSSILQSMENLAVNIVLSFGNLLQLLFVQLTFSFL